MELDRRREAHLQERKQVLTPQTAKQVLFSSFYFSQGQPALQLYLFRYLHQIRPHWRMDDAMVRTLHTLIPAVQRLPEKGMHIDLDFSQTLGEVNEQARTMQQALNGRAADLGHSLLLGFIMSDVLERDKHFLVEKNGRPKAERTHHLLQGKPGYNPMKDPYLSHFIWYGVLGNPTGVPEFDELFGEIGQHARAGSRVFEHVMKTNSANQWLNQVIAVYATKHTTFPISSVLI